MEEKKKKGKRVKYKPSSSPNKESGITFVMENRAILEKVESRNG